MTRERDDFLHCISDDLDAINERLDRLVRGKIRNVDCYPIVISILKNNLRTIKEQIALAVVPSKD